jgi:hypothetical protein
MQSNLSISISVCGKPGIKAEQNGSSELLFCYFRPKKNCTEGPLKIEIVVQHAKGS